LWWWGVPLMAQNHARVDTLEFGAEFYPDFEILPKKQN